MRIAVVDYGAGNLRSVARALAAAGGAPRLVADPRGLAGAEAIVIPGVGAFDAAMRRLSAAGLVAPLREAAAAGTPLVGICLGMQVLFERSEEGEPTPGLGLLRGEVRRLPAGVKVPHMGWNVVEAVRPDPLLAGLPPTPYVYFVHSYVAVPADRHDVVAETTYGTRFPAVVRRRGLWGLQFHPEKSSRMGGVLLRNLLAAIAAERSAA